MKTFQTMISAAVISIALAGPGLTATQPSAVVKGYADLAEAMYSDSLTAAKGLQTAIDAFLASPSDETLKAAREAWKTARVPYQQTEGFRFGNPVVDEWEGKVNAWPLDEGMIDYVDAGSYGATSDSNPLYTANVIANEEIRIGKDEVDASKIDKDLLGKLQEAGGVESNVATGYHAVEFLLWGQDLNGTGPGAGNRPFTDYLTEGGTGGHNDRRRDYLKAATDLLVDDLQEIVEAWGKDGDARKEVIAKDGKEGLTTILTGLGSLSYGELAGERIKLGLILHDPEEEHDCFSDNTHNSHYYDQVGMVAIYKGTYKASDGKVTKGPGLAAYAAEKAPKEAKAVEAAMKKAEDALAAIKKRAADGVESYDQMIGEGNEEGNKLVQAAVDGLVGQARAIETLVAKLGLKIEVEGSDSLDNPSAVQ
ncbi:imelysin family protein [Terrihabitans rhizophilus]|uniref:Imelysin family protein n=1 Tax=Terrihabitans rhizophilus TaxID=3092662 RepID=A0ABU4RKJ2_9HYPH|nr:imelysin family protein [Terrihabitans sp. PJ23]MDX6804723.1 imelysin family protein [Terrihabitans sp. PJ23]